MKNIIGLMVVMLLLLVACGGKEVSVDLQNNNALDSGDSNTSQMIDDAFFLNGPLKEINNNRVLIDTKEAGLVWVSLEDGLTMDVSLNSIVRIQYNGTIAESYPGQASGHSLEVVDPFLTKAAFSYEEMNALLAEGDVNHVIVWNNVKDTVAYASVDLKKLDSSYRVFVASVYGGDPIEIAYVVGEVPDINWYYDRVEVQTSMGSVVVGPDFDDVSEPTLIDTVGKGVTTDVDIPVGPTYNIVNKVYENTETSVRIEYFQVEGMVGELVQDYVNQSLRKVVDVYGENYTDTKITAQILRQDGFLTIAYHGTNEAMAYKIDRFITLDMATSTVLSVNNIIGDMEAFKKLFEETSGYAYDTLEGVTVYMEKEAIVFTFVPTDDHAVRTYVRFNQLELAPILDLDFDMPAS